MKYHQKKTFVLQLLDKLPSSLGYLIYHLLQTNPLHNINAKIKATSASLGKFNEILSKNDCKLKGQDVIEIGSGWLPIFPFLLKSKSDVNKIFTFDINEHYSKKRVLAITKQFDQLKYSSNDSKYCLPDFIEYHPKTNFINAEINKNVSVVFSRFVLEHVKPNDIFLMHKKIHKELKDGVKIIHHISPSDHRAYTDSSLSYYDFLKYSQSEWDKIQTKFDYHNRLRLPQYLEIFEKSGFKIIHLEHDHVDQTSEKYNKFKALKLHPDYSKFSEEEILAGSIFVLLIKK